MRLVAITSASKPSIAINATQRAIRARITPCMARPPEPRRPPADEWFNSVHLWRRNRDGNEESTGRICDEARRITVCLVAICLEQLSRRQNRKGKLRSPSSHNTLRSLAPEPNPARGIVLGKWTGNDAPIPAPKFPVPRSPAALRRAGLSLAADSQQAA